MKSWMAWAAAALGTLISASGRLLDIIGLGGIGDDLAGWRRYLAWAIDGVVELTPLDRDWETP